MFHVSVWSEDRSRSVPAPSMSKMRKELRLLDSRYDVTAGRLNCAPPNIVMNVSSMLDSNGAFNVGPIPLSVILPFVKLVKAGAFKIPPEPSDIVVPERFVNSDKVRLDSPDTLMDPVTVVNCGTITNCAGRPARWL